SPDGSKIAFATTRDEPSPDPAGNTEIYVMNADGTGPTNLTNNPASDGDPAWSPAGNKIAFMTVRNGPDREIYTMNADGTGQTKLADGGVDTTLSWSPDGRKIAFNTPYSGEPHAIYTMNADGTNLTNLSGAPAQD